MSAGTGGPSPVIAFDGVGKRYGEVTAVADVRFEIRPGEFFSLLGPSGCGKTTLLRLAAGFEDATSGTIRLDGADVSGVPPYRRDVNTVFQHYALFPHISVFDNVAFGPRARRLDAEEVARRVRRALDVVRLGGLADRRPDRLSGGQRQRVALARALVNSPRALLLDEPLGALDLALRQAMQLELKRIQREVGIAFLFVTHDQDEALAMSDRIAVMRRGRVEQVGTPEAIYDAPANIFVAGFIGRANLLPATVERVDGGVAAVRLTIGPCVDVPLGTARFGPGDRAVVMVRPERVRVATAPAAAPGNAIPVTLSEVVFQGPIVRCLLRAGSGQDIVAHLAAPERPARLEPGAALCVAWEPGAARLLPSCEEGGQSL